MAQQSHERSLVLASSSPYRKMLLERLGLAFRVWSPDVDESRAEGESGHDLVARLACLKAEAAAARFPSAIVIGADQVAVCGSSIIGKPKTAERAERQLSSFSNRTVEFLSAVSFRCAETGFQLDRTVTTVVRFRPLEADEISRYVRRDRPLECAGSFKSEESGIALLRSMSSDDPTAIIGLPLITTAEALRQAGLQVP